MSRHPELGQTDQSEAERSEAERSDDEGSEAERSEAEASDDDWAWRRRLRSKPHTRLVYRLTIFAVGLVIVVGGLALVPLPGPGWLIVICGLIVWASEFELAQRLLHWVRRQLHTWNEWLKPKPWWVKGAVGLATFALVLAVFYGMFWLSGVPSYLPDPVESWLLGLPGRAS